MANSKLVINCYLNAEFADETYWFLRNKKGDNISKLLFRNEKFQVPLTMKTLKGEIFSRLHEQYIEGHNFTAEFKDYKLLQVGSVSFNRAKVGAKAAINKYKCKPIPDDAIFENGDLELDIILMPVATKSSSTKKRGGTSTSPLSVIKSVTATFIAEQSSFCKLGNSLSACFDKLHFLGTSLERLKAVGSVVNLHCSSTDLLVDNEIVAAGENVKGHLVLQRIKERIANLDVLCQLPTNCFFKKPKASLQPWRRAPEAFAANQDVEEAPNPKRRRITEKRLCECSRRTAPRNGT